MKKIKLENISIKISSGLTPLRTNETYWSNGDIPWVKTEQIGVKNIYDSNEKISRIALKETSIKLNPKNTISIAMYGEGKTRGSVSILRNEVTTNQACCNIVIDKTKADFEYVYYFLKTQYDNLRSLSSGVRKNLNSADIKNFKINIPTSLNCQNQIAKVLSDLDAKIELNNKINTELEAMAKLIYDYWFVQFDFPNEDGLPYKSSGGNMVWNEELKREIPEGWEVKELSKVLSIKYGKDHKKLNNGIIPVYGSGGVMRYVDEYLYNDETILIPRKGSIGNLFYVNEPFWSVDTMFYTKASKKGSVLYYFYQLSKLNLLTLNVGTAVPSLTVEILNKIKLLAPEPIILEKFNSIIFRNKEKSLSIIKENQKLSELRDWLLPMLMNGQVKVK